MLTFLTATTAKTRGEHKKKELGLTAIMQEPFSYNRESYFNDTFKRKNANLSASASNMACKKQALSNKDEILENPNKELHNSHSSF